MKLRIGTVLLAFFSVVALAAETPKEQIIVSFPKGTPTQVYDEAKAAIEAAGGTIITEYHLIMGFVAKTSKRMLNEIQAMGESHGVMVEQDSTVSINNS